MKYILNDKKSFSILLTLFIISALLTSAVLVSDVLIRQARLNRSVTNSEMALYAAESGGEKVAYQVVKNHCQIGSGCAQSGTLDNGATYSVADSGANITATTSTSPWTVKLQAGQSFVLYLDLNGVAYPSDGQIQFTAPSDASTDLIVLNVSDGTETIYTDLSSAVTVAINLDANHYLTSYYKITLHNRNTGTSYYVYSLSWLGDLPQVLKIGDASGKFQSYQRDLELDFPRWQIFGSN